MDGIRNSAENNSSTNYATTNVLEPMYQWHDKLSDDETPSWRIVLQQNER